MEIIGALLTLVAAVAAVGVSGLMLWTGWRAVQDELLPGFKTIPPGPRSLSLTLLGVVLPIVAIAAFTLYLAVWLGRIALNSLT